MEENISDIHELSNMVYLIVNDTNPSRYTAIGGS